MFDKLKNAYKAFNQPVNKSPYNYLPVQIAGGGSLSPNYMTLSSNKALMGAYLNPAVQPAINIWGRAVSNMKRSIKQLSTGIVYDDETIKSAPKEIQNLYSLLKQPNPFMSEGEFLNMRTIVQKINGNSYTYYNVPEAFQARGKLKINDITSIYSMWPQYTMPLTTSTPELFPNTLAETIKGYHFEYSNYKITIPSYLIMHSNEVNPYLSSGLNNSPYKGLSPLMADKETISNVAAALAARNVFHTQRGAIGLFSPDKKDSSGQMPMLSSEREQFDKDMEDFGIQHNQSKIYVTNTPMKYTQIAIDPKNLGLFEEVWNSAILIANTLGVPKNLVETYLNGATFDNQEKAWLRFYQDSVIPFAFGQVEAENTTLGLKDIGYAIVGDFSHLPILQEDQKRQAETREKNVKATIEAFKYNAATIQDIARANGLESDDERTIFELSDKEIEIVLNKFEDENTNEGTGGSNQEA